MSDFLTELKLIILSASMKEQARFAEPSKVVIPPPWWHADPEAIEDL